MAESKKHTFRILFALATAVLAALLLTSCSGTGETDTGEGDITSDDLSENSAAYESVSESETESETDEAEDESETDDGSFSFDKNILISAYWPPTLKYVNDRQYELLAEADIDWVLGLGTDLMDESTQRTMLDLCAKYGMQMAVAEKNYGANFLRMTRRDIIDFVKKYGDYENCKGFFIVDEPYNPNIFIDVYDAMKTAYPEGYMHLNFLVHYAYPSTKVYMSQMNDWCKLCANTGYPLDYLMFDNYPFGLADGSLKRTSFYLNLNAVRIIGLKNNVRTATYLQSVEQPTLYRSLNREETLYEINMSLAFGMKQLSYFTWFTPTGQAEPFQDAIIGSNGRPNEKYEFICELNKYTHVIGKTLVKCDALEVYETKKTQDVMPLVPDDFFLNFTKGDVTVSYLKNKTNGRNYVMIVNNNFQKSHTVGFEFTDALDGYDLSEICMLNYETGEFEPMNLNGNKFEIKLSASAALLIRLPKGYDYSKQHEWIPASEENLALHAEISCNSSLGEDYWYMDNLNDGVKKTEDLNNGWRSNKEKESVIVIDFGMTVAFNRVDIYPVGTQSFFAQYFAKSMTVSVSNDGINYTEVGGFDKYTPADKNIPSITFDTQQARYIKIYTNDYLNDDLRIAEIEVYNDLGNVRAPSVRS